MRRRLRVLRDLRVGDPAHESTRIHLAEELHSLGFDVSTPPISPDEQDAAVIAVRNYEPVGVLMVEGGDIEVWIVGKDGAPMLSEVVRAPGEDRRTGVLRAVERLRASLLKIGVKLPPKARPAVAAPPETPASREQERPPEPVQPSYDRMRLGLGGSVVNSRGGVGTTGHARVGLRWAPGRDWGFDGFGLLPLVDATVEAEEGSASFSPALVGAGVWSTVGPGGRVEPTVEAGVAAVFVDTQEEAEGGFEGKHDANVVALPYVGFGVGAAVTESWSVRADLMGGSSVPRTKVLYAGREVAMWGSLVFAGSASVELVLF